MNSILFILACAGILMSAQADAASVSTSLRVSAVTISTGTHLNIEFTDNDHLSLDSSDPTSLLHASGAGGDEHSNDARHDAFRQELLAHLKHLSLLEGVAYKLSLKNNSYGIWRLFIQNNNPLIFNHFLDSFEIKMDKSSIIISLSH